MPDPSPTPPDARPSAAAPDMPAAARSGAARAPDEAAHARTHAASSGCAATASPKPAARHRWQRRLALGVGLVLFALIAPLGLIDLAVSLSARDAITDSLEAVEPMPVALILGTARTHRGRPNQFYRARIEAAAALFHSGRVRGILVSGDNATRHYNEPIVMQKDLMTLGVPSEYITLDYAGFRTLDSVVRAKKVFGLEQVLIVSQRFHTARALFLARHFALQARGFAAANPSHAGSGFLRVRTREVFARVAALLDIITGQGPRFLGKHETVRLRPAPALPSARTEQQPQDEPQDRQQQDDDDPQHLGQGAGAALDDLHERIHHDNEVQQPE